MPALRAARLYSALFLLGLATGLNPPAMAAPRAGAHGVTADNTRPTSGTRPLAPTTGLATAAATSRITHGRFVDLPVHMPKGPVKHFVLWFRDRDVAATRGAELAVILGTGAMVAEVAARDLERALRKDGGRCIFGAGDVENFSRYIQAYYRLPTYYAPILVGDGEGAGLAYAILAQAPRATFAGAISLDFCPQLAVGKPICADQQLHLASLRGSAEATLQSAPLTAPWFYLSAADGPRPACKAAAVDRFVAGIPGARELTLDGHDSPLPALRTAIDSMGAKRGASMPPPPADLSGLPVVEVPAAARKPGDTFAIFASGDGGWAGLDKEVAGALAQAGIPVIGIDSLRYFWSRRTPQGFANDLDRIIRYYAQHFGRKRVLLIGFSQGADVLPAAINRLPARIKDMVSLNALLSLGKQADYEFHLSNWLGGSGDDALPIAPEMARLPGTRTLCVYGEDDDDAICPSLKSGQAKVVKLPGDHHFDGDYAKVAQTVLQALQSAPPPTQ